MSEVKKISLEVSKELWKRLKILSINKDISLKDLICEYLDKVAFGKKVDNLINEDK